VEGSAPGERVIIPQEAPTRCSLKPDLHFQEGVEEGEEGELGKRERKRSPEREKEVHNLEGGGEAPN